MQHQMLLEKKRFLVGDPLAETSEPLFKIKTSFLVMKDGNCVVNCPDGTPFL